MNEPLHERLWAYLSRPDYVPQDRSAIARGMGVSGAERAELRALLAQAEAERRLLRLRGARLAPAAATGSSYVGSIRVTARGKMCFVPHAEGQRALAALLPAGAAEGELYVPLQPARSMGAMDGDVVRAAVRRTAPAGYRRRKKGPRPAELSELALTARVEEVLQRRCNRWVGTYIMKGRTPMVRGNGRDAPACIRLSAPPPPNALVGMLVVVEPVSPAEGRGRIESVLGWPDDDGVDMAALIHRYGLRVEFDDDVLEETLRLPQQPAESDCAARDDWRGRCVVTIDPPDARDYDDAISLRRMPDGGWELAVHIADVAHYVQPGSATDAEARRRGNSTYLPDRVLPMLPPRLCDDLCSLVQGEPRLTMLCRMTIAPTGDVVGAQLARAVIVSRRRLDYPTVQALLEHGQSTGDAEVDAMLREAAQLAELLRRKRFELGALDLDVPELRVRLDEHGHVAGFTREVSDDSHRLIEEMMLAANEQVARLLRERGLPAIYRVHEEPAADKWRDLVHTLREYGISVPPTPGRRETARIMELIRGHAEEERLKMLVLRAMMRARYAPRPLGHFGLAKSDYCHFTSPIRRYADLVVHRSVARLTDRRSSTPLPDAGRLQHLTDHLSDAERRSAAAELEATRLKLMAYLAEQAASPHPTAWDAVVCGVWAHGLAVELTELRLRGYVPAAALPRRSGWHYAGREWRNSQIALAEGAHLAVVPHAVEWESQSVEFAPADLYE